MDVTFVFKLFRRNLWLLILVPLITGVAASFLTLRMTLHYKSEATIATNFTTGDPVSIDGARINYFESTVNFVNAIETMNSPMILDLVSFELLRNDLNPDRIPFRKPAEPLLIDVDTTKLVKLLSQKLASFEYINPLLKDEKAAADLIKAQEYDKKSLLENLSVTRVNNSDFINVSFLSEDPLLSAFVVNAISDQFIRFHDHIRVNNSSESLNFFSLLVKEKENALRQRTDRLNIFKLQNNVVDLTAESQAKVSLITQLEQSRSATDAELRNIQIELQYINGVLSNSGGGKEKDERIAASNKKISDLRSEITRLNGEFVDGGSTDSGLSSRIQQLNHELALEMSNASALTLSADGVAAEDLIARKRELELKEKMTVVKLSDDQNAIEKQRLSVSSTVGKDAEYANLLADVNIASEEYKMAQEKYNRALNEAMAVSKSGLRKIVPAQPADEPEPSKQILIIGLSMAASLTLCISYILVAAFVDTKIRIPSQLERHTNIRNVGIINQLKADIRSLPGLLTSRVNQDKVAPELLMFKQLLGKIRFEAEQNQAKVLMVTSTREQVGKSYLIMGLAYSLSLINKKVLIIDTNFKNNSLTRLLVRNSNTRLLKESNLEQDEDPEETTRQSIISPTFHANIDIIGNDGGNYSPLEIFKGGDFRTFLDAVGAQYDYILMEGASLNAFSDSYELCQYVDKVIAVFSAQTEISESDRNSLDLLKSLRGKLIGTVLNRVEMTNLML